MGEIFCWWGLIMIGKIKGMCVRLRGLGGIFRVKFLGCLQHRFVLELQIGAVVFLWNDWGVFL